MKRKTTLRIWIGVCLVTGVWLRFFRLGTPSFWLDELFSRRAALAPSLRESVLQGAVNDMFPPLFPILSHWAVRLPGDAETVFRMPSALAGCACLFVVYLLGAALHSPRVGLVASGLLSSHWFAVAYSQEARPYALLMLLSTLSAYLAVCVVARQRRNEATARVLLGLGVAGFLLCSLHYVGVLFFAGVGFALLAICLRDRAPVRGVLVTFGVVGASFLPWLPIVASQVERRLTFKQPPALGQIARTYSDLLARHPVLFIVLLALGWLAWRRAPASPAGGVSRSRADLRASTEVAFTSAERYTLLALWATLPVLVTFCLSHAVVPFYTTRNMIVMLPAFALLAAIAAQHIERAFLRGLPLVSLALIAGLAVDLVWVKHYYTANKEPFDQFVQHIVAARTPDDGLIVQPARYADFVEQYLDLQGSDLRVSRPGDGHAAHTPRVLWILARDEQPPPPSHYRAVASWIHEPNAGLPWKGQPMSLTRYERVR